MMRKKGTSNSQPTMSEHDDAAEQASGTPDAYGWYLGEDGQPQRVSLGFDDEDRDAESLMDMTDVGDVLEEPLDEADATENTQAEEMAGKKDTTVADDDSEDIAEGKPGPNDAPPVPGTPVEVPKESLADRRRSDRIAALSSSPRYTGTRIRTGL